MRQHNLRVTGSLTINGENVISASELSTLSASINSKIEGLNPSQIGTGSYTASISPNGVFSVNTNTIITGSLSVTSLSGSGVNYLAYSGGIVTAISGTAAIKYTQEFTATLGQTIFTPSVGYVSGLIDVFYNGTKLSAADYTATNGYNISLVQGADLAGDIIEIDIYNPVSGVSNNVLRQQTTFTASVAQTTFLVNYTPGLIDIFFNGSRLANEEYTANNGTSIILSEATTGGEILDVFVYSYQVGAFSGIGGQGQTGQFAYFSSQNGISGSSIIAISGSDIIAGGDIIPSQSGSYDLGSLEKPFRHIYVGTGSIYLVDNSGQVTNTISAQSIVTTDTLNSGTIDLTKSLPTGTVSGSSQIVGILSSLNTATASFTPRISNLESKSASVDITISSINSKTGSYATTGSNTFFGTQTYSGSVYIANDLVVQGSSSIQYISASSVSIGTNIVQLNTANPSVRFAGLTIIDSGSIGGSGSFLYDSVHDEFIFVHRGNGTNVTSSHFVLGPETYDNLGNELYLTCNIISKGTGKEHLVDSCIFDNGTTVCVNATIKASGQVCGIMGNFSCIGIGTSSPNRALSIQGIGDSWIENITTATTTQCWLIGQDGSRKGFEVYDINQTKTRFFVAPTNGNIGIGTTCIISAYGFEKTVSIESCNNAELQLKQTCNNNCFSIGITNGVNYFQSNQGYDFQVGGSTKLRISSTGYVGVGITAPTAQLHICSAYSQTPLVVQGGGNGNVPIACFYSGVNQITLLDDNGNLIIGSCSFSTRVTTTSSGAVISGKVSIGGSCPNATYLQLGDWCNRAGRLLTSNHAQWIGDGPTPLMVITSGNSTSTCKGQAIGLALHNDSQTCGSYTPILAFSRRSYSGIYNSTMAAIMAQSSLCGTDANWNGGDLVFSTTPNGGYMSESMRITGGGGVVVGSTLASPTGAENGWWVRTTNNPRAYFSSTTEALAINRYGSTGTMIAFDYAGGGIGSITTNGSTITFSGNALSDNRYKDNIETISNAVDAINKVDWVTFKYKDNQRDSAGVTAQQLQTVPELLKFVIHGINEDSYKAVDYNAIIGYVGAAIQEQQCTIQCLTNRIEQLENK